MSSLRRMGKNVVAIAIGCVIACALWIVLESIFYFLLRSPLKAELDLKRRDRAYVETQERRAETAKRAGELKFRLATSFDRRERVAPEKYPEGLDSWNIQKVVPPEFFKREPGRAAEPGDLRTFRMTGLHVPSNTSVYDTHYTIDRIGHRFTPGASASADKFAVFLGCSYTFGEGLNDDQTLPYFFQKSRPSYRSYNYASSAFGPNDLLARLRADGARHVSEKKGVILYLFIDSHLDRLVGNSKWVYGSQGFNAHFYEDGDGRLLQGANFRTDRPFLMLFSRFAQMSSVLRFFNVSWPEGTSEAGKRLFIKVVQELKRGYLEELPGAKFVVVLYPMEHNAQLLIPYLERAGIHYLDYSYINPSAFTKELAYIPIDGHPSAAANGVLADQLVRDLENL